MSHPFCEAILWSNGASIGLGYRDGSFRPGAPVSREALAAFLHRMAEYRYYTGHGPPIPSPTLVPSDQPVLGPRTPEPLRPALVTVPLVYLVPSVPAPR